MSDKNGLAGDTVAAPSDDAWVGECLDMVREVLEAGLGTGTIAPMFYPEAIRSLCFKRAKEVLQLALGTDDVQGIIDRFNSGERFNPAAPSTEPPSEKLKGADRLAREVRKLIERGVIGSRSPAADALLDYAQERHGQGLDAISKVVAAPISESETMDERFARINTTRIANGLDPIDFDAPIELIPVQQFSESETPPPQDCKCEWVNGQMLSRDLDCPQHGSVYRSKQPPPPPQDIEKMLDSLADALHPVCGENPILSPERLGCGKHIASWAEVYRCTECHIPFHRDCALRHFERDKAGLDKITDDDVSNADVSYGQARLKSFLAARQAILDYVSRLTRERDEAREEIKRLGGRTVEADETYCRRLNEKMARSRGND